MCPAHPERAAAARRDALHHPAPDHRALAQAGPARAALRPRPDACRRARPRPEAARPGQAHPADPDRAVVGPRHAHADRVRRVPRVPLHLLGVPVLAVPRGRVHPRQQERRHAAGVRPRPRGPGGAERAAAPAGRLRRVPGLPAPAGPPRAGRAARPRLDARRTRSTPSWCRPSPTSTSTPTSSGRCTRRARSWSTSRTTSSSGGSATSRRSSGSIGSKRGTGGSSGVPFLRRALELTFFPELYAVRAEIGVNVP